jgi:hypothetical protein
MSKSIVTCVTLFLNLTAIQVLGFEHRPQLENEHNNDAESYSPYQFNMSFREMPREVDPILTWLKLKIKNHQRVGRYAIADGRPTVAVDPARMNIVVISDWTVTNTVSLVPRSLSEKCFCGTATLKAMVDAHRFQSADIHAGRVIMNTPPGGGGIGPIMRFSWDATPMPEADEESCCKVVGWKQWTDKEKKNLDTAPGLVDAQGFILTGRSGSEMIDRPHTEVMGLEVPANQKGTIRAEAICRDTGPLNGLVVYTVVSNLKCNRKAHKWGR